MPPTLPDDADEWAKTWRERLNDSPAFTEAAADFEARVLFAIQADGDTAVDGDAVRLLVSIDEGHCVAAAALGDADADPDYDYALRGPYDAWKRLLADDIDAAEAVLDGPFDVEGSTIKLLQHRDAFAEMVRAAKSIDVEFAR